MLVRRRGARNPDRVTFTRTLTDGTRRHARPRGRPHRHGRRCTATSSRRRSRTSTTGANPTATGRRRATRLRYTLRIQSRPTPPLDDSRFHDDLGRAERRGGVRAGHAHASSAVSRPAPTRATRTRPAAPTAPACSTSRNLDVSGEQPGRRSSSRSRSPAGLANGTVVLEPVADLIRNGAPLADSDDPNINGQADPIVVGRRGSRRAS